MKYTTPPGVFDIIPEDGKEHWKSSYLWSHIEGIAGEIAADFNFSEIRTPLFEKTELFQRSVGEGSDIVSKEMYTFQDKGGRSLSLRPEGTAPAMRAFIEHRLHEAGPVQKLFYISPMFRYERSQAGRYRQHHQFGAEVIGDATPEQDAEIISLLHLFYMRAGIKNLTLYINSIGDSSARQAFRTALKDYLTPRFDSLSGDSKARLETNPMRILDSKDPGDRQIVAGAPSIFDFLNEKSRMHFDRLKECLHLLSIPFEVNPLLVRGLDYYNDTVFEVTAGELGAQNSIGGGGRYDTLLKTLGGPDLPAIGFGTGMERIIQTLVGQGGTLPGPSSPTIFLVPMGETAGAFCFSLLYLLREERIPAQMDFSGKKVGKALQFADQLKAAYVAVIGDLELESGEIELKELATGKKTRVRKELLVETLKTLKK